MDDAASSERRAADFLAHSRQKSLNRFGASVVLTVVLVIDPMREPSPEWRGCHTPW
jgi:hypothetical protein